MHTIPGTLSCFKFALLFICLFCAFAGAQLAPADDVELGELLRELALPLEDGDSLAPLLDRAAEARYVLLGEASHGTSEYYTWRDKISRRLIADHGFRFIAVEGDWEACYRINEYVKQLPGAMPDARSVLESFDRWPQWMWANEEVLALVEWLREYNDGRPMEERAGFYGIDLYGLSDSIKVVSGYLERAELDEETAAQLAAAYECFAPFDGSFQEYSRAVAQGYAGCADGAATVLAHLREHAGEYRETDPQAYFNAKLNAVVVQNAEAHYRAMASGGGLSWNVRVAHFKETVERLMDYKGEGAKGIVWAHNTHIGDARATAMGDHGRNNIGQLLRQRHGIDEVYAIGFGTHRGEVLAGSAWEAPRQTMPVPPAPPGTYEHFFHQTAQALEKGQFMLLMGRDFWEGPLQPRRGHRAIGVVYNPRNERGNYVPTALALRYDAFIHIDETTALSPVHP